MSKPNIQEQIGKETILKIIKDNQPITIHALYKRSPYGSYSGMWDCVKRLEERGLIEIEKIRIDKYVKMLRIKEDD